MDSRLAELLDELNTLDKDELIRALVDMHSEMRGAFKRRDETVELLDETRNYTDTLKRRTDLIQAIADTVSENALDPNQLNKIAEIIWPAPVGGIRVVDTWPDLDPTTVPTKLGMGLSNIALEAMLLQASGFIWNAHWFLKTVEELCAGTGISRGVFELGDFKRQIEQWRDKVNVWRHATGVEKHETEEIRAMPH